METAILFCWLYCQTEYPIDLARFPPQEYAAIQVQVWNEAVDRMNEAEEFAITRRHLDEMREPVDYVRRSCRAWCALYDAHESAKSGDRLEMRRSLFELRSIIGERSWAAGQMPQPY